MILDIKWSVKLSHIYQEQVKCIMQFLFDWDFALFYSLISYVRILLVGLPISEELNDSWASKTMRLEMEKEEVDHELHEAKLRITEKQREIDQIKLEHTDQLAQKTSECHQQVSAVKRQVSELEKKVTDKENAHSRQVGWGAM